MASASFNPAIDFASQDSELLDKLRALVEDNFNVRNGRTEQPEWEADYRAMTALLDKVQANVPKTSEQRAIENSRQRAEDRARAQERGAITTEDLRSAAVEMLPGAEGDEKRTDRIYTVLGGLTNLEGARIRDVMLPTGVFAADRNNLTLSDLERTIVANAEHLHAERMKALRELDGTMEVAVKIGKTMGSELPEGYRKDLSDQVASLYEGLASGLDAIEPNAAQIYKAFRAVPPPQTLTHPALQGLAAALHDVSVHDLTDGKMRYLTEATEDLLNMPMPSELSKAQEDRMNESLVRHGVEPKIIPYEQFRELYRQNEGENLAADYALHQRQAVDYYIRSGMAVLDRAGDLADEEVSIGIAEPVDFLTIKHDQAFDSELSEHFARHTQPSREQSAELIEEREERRVADRRAREEYIHDLADDNDAGLA